MFRNFISSFVLLLSAATFAAAQTPDLQTILSEAQKQTEFYRETFRNLLADEVKTFEEFDKNGDSDKKTVVKSTFLVYQSGKNAKRTAELRNVTEVDGKAVADSQKRSGELLAELEKASTLESELRQIEKESLRYDKTWIINGLTLNEGFVLQPELRSVFEFKLVGSENLPDSNYYVVSYRQIKPSSYIVFNGKDGKTNNLILQLQLDVPKPFKKDDLILDGKLWIDARNFQILREERNVVNKSGETLVLHSTDLEYQPSQYGILVPKNFTMTFYDTKKNGGNYATVKDAVVSFAYSNFRQTNTDVIILDN